MSTHPEIDTLFAAASDRRPSAAITVHLAGCPACSVAFTRLQEGARLIAEARVAPVDVHWEAMDDAIAAEAERIAAELRASNVRQIRPWGRWAAGGLTFAAAAVALLAVRSGYLPMPHGDVSSRHPVVLHPNLTRLDAALYEGSVLLSAGGATVADASGSHTLASATGIHEGGRITTGAHGRGVVTVQPGVTLDVRPDSDVHLSRLRSGEVTVAMADGAVAIQTTDPAAHDARVSLHAGHWTVTEDGPVTAQIIPGMLHVVVLGSSVSVTRDGASTVRYGGPIVLDLPEMGAGALVEDGVTARDPDALDVSVLSQGGQLWTLPAIDPTAQVSATGHGAMPAGLEVLRVSSPLSLRARTPHGTVILDVGTGRPMEWVHAPSAPTASPVVAAADPGLAHAAPEILERQMRAHTEQATGRFQNCVSICQARGRCAGPMHGSVELNLGADGRVTSAVVDPSLHDAQRCIENETPFLTAFPAGLHAVRIPVN